MAEVSHSSAISLSKSSMATAGAVVNAIPSNWASATEVFIAWSHTREIYDENQIGISEQSIP